MITPYYPHFISWLYSHRLPAKPRCPKRIPRDRPLWPWRRWTDKRRVSRSCRNGGRVERTGGRLCLKMAGTMFCRWSHRCLKMGSGSFHHISSFNQGLVNVPFWGFWTSPWNICWKLYPQYLGDVQLGHLPTPVNFKSWNCAVFFLAEQLSLHFFRWRPVEAEGTMQKLIQPRWRSRLMKSEFQESHHHPPMKPPEKQWLPNGLIRFN